MIQLNFHNFLDIREISYFVCVYLCTKFGNLCTMKLSFIKLKHRQLLDCLQNVTQQHTLQCTASESDKIEEELSPKAGEEVREEAPQVGRPGPV